MYLKIKFILIALTVAFSGFSQDLEKDLKAIGDKMASSNSVMINVNVAVRTEKGGSAVYKAKASLHKQGEGTKSVLDEMEFLRLEKYDIRVDHEEKMILIYDRKKGASSMNLESMDIDVKALKKLLDTDETTKSPTIKLLSNANNIKKYSVTGVDGFNEVQIVLDMNKLAIMSISYEYEATDLGGQFVQLEYTSFVYDSDLSQELSTTKYFSLNGGAIELTERFKDYTLYTEQ